MNIVKKIEKYYDFAGLNTNWVKEIVAGLALFMSLSYIFIVNPSILSQAGMPVGAVFLPLLSRLPFLRSLWVYMRDFLLLWRPALSQTGSWHLLWWGAWHLLGSRP